MTTDEKFTTLKNRLKQMDRVIIAFSGGVDSTFLLKTASMSGLSKVMAVTGVSASLSKDECAFAKNMAESFDVEYRTITTEELDNTNYTDNAPDRCYHCKKDLFVKLKDIAATENVPFILDGTNADDANDWRPGSRAAREEGVESPLLDIGLSKQEIRDVSKSLGLATWNKPATPCLSSRFPYGHKITIEALDRVEKAEAFIKKYGVKELRVRNHADVARIEVLPEDIPKIIDGPVRDEINNFLKSIGFTYVTIDLQGFRSGSSNEGLEKTD
jgi:uncharacterized protein